jgi:hypothetical protein
MAGLGASTAPATVVDHDVGGGVDRASSGVRSTTTCLGQNQQKRFSIGCALPERWDPWRAAAWRLDENDVGPSLPELPRECSGPVGQIEHPDPRK